jgi:Fe-S-cluster containining protein
MTDPEPDPDLLPAGDLASWLAQIRRALLGDGTSIVPCGACTACCTSSQFVHVEPDEVDALAHIPGDLLVPAPGAPPGHLVLGYDERGHCPMLADGRCSIYEHRPRACRVYDCRIFAATGIEPDQPRIAERVRRWRFARPTPEDRRADEALRAAAASLAEGGAGNATERALRATALAASGVLDDDRPGSADEAVGR